MKRLRASVVCAKNGKLLLVKHRDPKSKDVFWTVPGGKIEPNEAPYETAVRETLEETGYRVKPDLSTEFVTEYPFLWNGKHYECTTFWYHACLTPEEQIPEKLCSETYVLESGWLPIRELKHIFSYSREIYDTVKHFIKEVF